MNKRILSLGAFLLLANAYSSFGQVRSEYFRSLSVDLEANGGIMTQKIKAIPFSTNYQDALNTTQSEIKFSSGSSRGANFRLGYYFDKRRKFGVGIGLDYYKQQGNLQMDTFHVEFRSKDDAGGTFRQSISTTRSIKETMTASTLNMPILLRYKKDFNENLALTIDAGILYNISVKNTYSSDAGFDYEAIYKFEGATPIYDNSPVPSGSDELITKQYYTTRHPELDVVEYFRFQDSIGRRVGLNLQPTQKTGNVKYKSGTLGYTGEVAINYMVVRNVCIRVGAYYFANSFKNTSNNNSLNLTDNTVKDASGKTVGVNYNSLLNEVQTAKTNNFGLMIGMRVYFNKMAWKAPENDMNKITPAQGRAE